jgi:hypothetical protein
MRLGEAVISTALLSIYVGARGTALAIAAARSLTRNGQAV